MKNLRYQMMLYSLEECHNAMDYFFTKMRDFKLNIHYDISSGNYQNSPMDGYKLDFEMSEFEETMIREELEKEIAGR